MNTDELKGKWKQVQGNVKKQWGKLTDDDLNVIKGNKDILLGKIQERYAITKEEAKKQMDKFDWK